MPLVGDQTSTLIRLSSNYLTRTGESTGFSRRVALIKGDETGHDGTRPNYSIPRGSGLISSEAGHVNYTILTFGCWKLR